MMLLRAMLFMSIALSGAITMTEVQTADAGQEKKVEKEAITIKRWIAAQKTFLDPKETMGFLEVVKDFRGNELIYWKVLSSEKGFTEPETGSEISDKAGNIWVVEKHSAADKFTRIKVTKKDPPKKP